MEEIKSDAEAIGMVREALIQKMFNIIRYPNKFIRSKDDLERLVAGQDTVLLKNHKNEYLALYIGKLVPGVDFNPSTEKRYPFNEEVYVFVHRRRDKYGGDYRINRLEFRPSDIKITPDGSLHENDAYRVNTLSQFCQARRFYFKYVMMLKEKGLLKTGI